MELAALQVVLKDALDSVAPPPAGPGGGVPQPAGYCSDDEFIEALEARFLVQSHVLGAHSMAHTRAIHPVQPHPRPTPRQPTCYLWPREHHLPPALRHGPCTRYAAC